MIFFTISFTIVFILRCFLCWRHGKQMYGSSRDTKVCFEHSHKKNSNSTFDYSICSTVYYPARASSFYFDIIIIIIKVHSYWALGALCCFDISISKQCLKLMLASVPLLVSLCNSIRLSPLIYRGNTHYCRTDSSYF